MNALGKTGCKTGHFASVGKMAQSLAGKGGAGEGNRTLVFSLEGCGKPLWNKGFAVKQRRNLLLLFNGLAGKCKTR